jgi:hypothetical protein
MPLPVKLASVPECDKEPLGKADLPDAGTAAVAAAVVTEILKGISGNLRFPQMLAFHIGKII